MKKPLVSIVMGSDSDLKIMSEAAHILEDLGIENEVQVVSAHRTPKETTDLAVNAKKRGIKVIIAGAGGAAALPGVLAAYTTLPVIGVPIKSKSMEGLDSLLSIAQMPPGVPVATVGVDGAKNAGLLAGKIIGLSDSSVAKKIENFKKEQKQGVLKKNNKLQIIGWKKYLTEN
ncbi:5-(carboxyamino)imidazole ribonucleotide mutase [Candidatus Curtissbacteria bacterium RIFCSPLOWO2_02_FULL_40_11]|uniref:N5-carboxyaminoimidazole ribonucleotide mutase n=2 Tax=Candidatus Curtissiibacteriota TaxID=1752717 RepID=A0A1F5GBP8_9BACT|nr:MAG: 5-(carboxyamino)imidazole ribonucleotide mutase [Candidatus Curtissbacteria bacterium RIFCSPHIGHO2_02_FULL_40_16b]OGD99129.1 MAG: 5-(carboxyamino)imidazole ribonucleotide mutase [Candidatus Curtissbacteria bacterium RIFCSPLOWO2_02_FULL_40_11]OGE13529.1 MAG: 5-(carboxyamino)imidazole ribonucleotide mutase [Candidatus Curtissbacteria bacterium RIFCSPLOWO2_12_FULL_38_9]